MFADQNIPHDGLNVMWGYSFTPVSHGNKKGSLKDMVVWLHQSSLKLLDVFSLNPMSAIDEKREHIPFQVGKKFTNGSDEIVDPKLGETELLRDADMDDTFTIN